jgi:type IV pilus biogenesis protein CpaD/CtpE
MDPADQERRAVVLDKYRRGAATGSERGPEERVQVKN